MDRNLPQNVPVHKKNLSLVKTETTINNLKIDSV